MEAAPIEPVKGPEKKDPSSIKRRVSRACDHCHRMRTRCNGQVPCSRCIELEYVCQYNREKKRRGKVPKHLQRQKEETAAHADLQSPHADNGASLHTPTHFQRVDALPETDEELWSPTHPVPLSQQFAHHETPVNNVSPPQWQHMPPHAGFERHPHQMIDPMLLGEIPPFPQEHMHDTVARNELMFSMNEMHLVSDSGTPVGIPPDFQNVAYPMHFPVARQSSPHSYGSVDTGSPLSGVSVVSSNLGACNTTSCRYPVLRPLLPHLGSILTVSMACDLLEFYFQSSSSVFMEPVSPYILGTVFRKRSFLRQHRPRKCSPALLASMLWIAAQTSEASYLTSSPSARGIVCQKLWKLTIDLLRPLVHSSSGSNGLTQRPGAIINPAAHEAFGVNGYDSGPLDSPVGDLDDVATYMNLGVVSSASEFKAASLRWWNAAWSLARELKLGRELPRDTSIDREQRMGDRSDTDANMSDGANSTAQAPAGSPSLALVEEMREERRRLWWLLYMIDRHLALCYNRPLFLLDNECEELHQPAPDTVWQTGEFYTGSSAPKRTGLTFQCTGHDVFGFLLPLMAILGDIIDLNYARNHPRFGQRQNRNWDLHQNEITLQLEKYGYSLQEFRNQHGCGPSSEQSRFNAGDIDPMKSEWNHQTRKVTAYGTHLMHVLHILLHGKWDPVSLLEDNNQWICSQSFLAATSNAVSSANAVEEILELDPDLSFMPYFFDKLQVDTNEGVVKACETLVRAHEAAVVTLSTEYQRNFRKVMISTLAQIKGVGHARDLSPAKRREVLALYRWNNLGSGLAI